MKAYFDTGVFVDYLSARTRSGAYLRATKRRGRSPMRLFEDAESCLFALGETHGGMTSCLTFYELEEASYRAMRGSASGFDGSDRDVITAADEIISLALVSAAVFGIALVDLTSKVINSRRGNNELEKRKIRAADSLHITTALGEGADLFITTDSKLIALNDVFACVTGSRLRCVDTDEAISILA